MRILVLNHNLPERGTFFRAREIARGFHARGHDVTFVYTGEGFYRPRLYKKEPRWTEWQSANWTPLRERGDGWSPLGFVQRLVRLRGPWDFVYTFSHEPVDQGIARLVRGSAFWMTDWCDLWNSRRGGIHDIRLWQRPLPDFASGLRGALVRASFHVEDALEEAAPCAADATSVISRPIGRYAIRRGVPREKIVHLVSGADTKRIAVMDQSECRRQLGLAKDDLIMGYVANTTPDNDQLEAALEIVWREAPTLRVVTAGPPWFRGKDDRLIDFDRIPFERVPVLLGAADFVVMPLRDVPFNRCRWPNKLGDYMASGRAVATCDVGDMGRAVAKHGLGAVGEATAEGLAEAILKLAGDEALRREAGMRAREAAEGPFSWKRQHRRLARFLSQRGVAV